MEGNVNLNQPNDFNVIDNDAVFGQDKAKTNSFYSKVFLYFGLGLLITSVITIGLSLLFKYTLLNGSADGIVTFGYTYLGICIGTFLVLMILNMVISYRVIRQHKSILGPYVLYSAVYGLFFSTIAALIGDPMIIGVSLGVTALLFLGMFGVASIFQNKIGTLAKVLSTLFIGVGLLLLVNLIILPFALFGGNYAAYFAQGTIYWITEAIFFAIFLLYTAIDFARIKQIAQKGAGTTNLALFCAYSIYTDFIAIFTYVLRFVLMFASNRDN